MLTDTPSASYRELRGRELSAADLRRKKGRVRDARALYRIDFDEFSRET
jgi:hypothetical protein